MKIYKTFQEPLIWKIINDLVLMFLVCSLMVSVTTAIRMIVDIFEGQINLKPKILVILLVISVLTSIISIIYFLVNRQKKKYVFKNYEQRYLWIKDFNFFESGREDNIWFFFLLILIITCWVTIGPSMLIDNHHSRGMIMFQLLTCLFLFSYSYNKKVWNVFPDPRDLYFFNNHPDYSPLILQTKYIDFINNKIEDDNPSLIIGQSFHVKVKEYPKNELEKSVIQILNPKTSKPTLVALIENSKIANEIRTGKAEFKTELLSIGEFGHLEIGIWILDVKSGNLD